MLFVRQRGTLARRSARHQKIDARIDLPLDQRPQRWFVERTIAPKGSNERRAVPVNMFVSPSVQSPKIRNHVPYKPVAAVSLP